MKTIDINCDLGEGVGSDAAIMPYISSANVACGYHAGNDRLMEEAIVLALKHGVAIGAHPGYPDKENFGRVAQDLPASEIYKLVSDQILLFQTKVKKAGSALHHVKAHGALYNQAAENSEIANAIARAINDIDSQMIWIGLANSEMERAAQKTGLKFAAEAFADRAYAADGLLLSRNKEGAVIHDVDVCKERVMMLANGKVKDVNGNILNLRADTICVHGDNQNALEMVKAIHQHLKENHIQIATL